MTSKPFLPYSRQHIDEADVAAVEEVLRGDWLTTGPSVQALERAVGELVGANHAIACANGTAGLHMAAVAAELKPGECAIVPAITFVATANVVRFCGAEVVFADVDPETGLMRPADLERAVEQAAGRGCRPRVVFPVHMTGQCENMQGIAAVARAHDLMIIEDAAHAIGARYDGDIPVGACRHSDMALFSFHAVKPATMGEGGVLTTNDERLARRARLFGNHGMSRDSSCFTQGDLGFDAAGEPNPWYYEMAAPGLNYRATDLQCALGRSQLNKLEAMRARRAALADHYDRALAPYAPDIRPLARRPGMTSAWHLYVALIDFSAFNCERGAVMRSMAKAGIGTQVHYIPVAWQPYYRERYGDTDVPGAADYYARCLSLPLFPAMSEDDVDRVVDALTEGLGMRQQLSQSALRC